MTFEHKKCANVTALGSMSLKFTIASLCLLLALSTTTETAQAGKVPTIQHEVECSGDYGVANPYDGSGGGGFVEGCHPKKCNRLVFDNFLDEEGVERLKGIAEKAIEVGRGDGGRPGPTILVRYRSCVCVCGGLDECVNNF